MFVRCLRAENRKLRGSVIWLAFFVIPLFPAIMGTYNYMQNLELLNNGWYDLWTQHTLFYASFFFAPLVGLYAAYLWRLEHLGHNWNTILSAPVRPFYLFFAKFVVVAKLVLLTQLWVFALFALCGHVWAGLPGVPPVDILLWLLRGALGGVAIIALELLLAMLLRSFAAPILAGLFGGVAGMAFTAKNAGLLFPYSLMLLGMNANRAENVLSGDFLPFLAACTVFSLVFCVAAQLCLTKRDVRT